LMVGFDALRARGNETLCLARQLAETASSKPWLAMCFELACWCGAGGLEATPPVGSTLSRDGRGRSG
jgi:hypothetical protein